MGRSESSSPPVRGINRHRDRYESRRGDYEERHHSIRDRGSPRRIDRDSKYEDRRRRSRSPSRSKYKHRRREESPDYHRHVKRFRHEENSRDGIDMSSADPPAVGSIVKGKVHTVKPFGLFVSLEGFQRHGLVHHSSVSEEVAFDQGDDDADRITALEYFFPVGTKVSVKIQEVQPDGRGGVKIGCSLKAVDQETGKDLDPDNAMAFQQRQGPLREGAPDLNSVHKAEVASIKPFGAFVRLDGYRVNGLVHVSQVSDHMDMDREASDEAKVAAIGQVLSVGESLWVKVVEIREAEPGSDRGPKVGCSIKLVSQRDGVDLDPHGLKHRPKPADGDFGQRRAVGADVGQVQEGQIDWGHLNAEKVNLDPQSTGYEILGADAEAIAPPGYAADMDNPPPPPKKGLKKQQKLQQQGINSVEEALAILKEHKKKGKGKKEKKDKKAKKSKKAKKRKHSHSSSSSDA